MLIFRINPFVYATGFTMRHRMRNNAHNGTLLNPNSLSAELQYSEWQKVTVAISLIENRSCTRIQFHGTAGNLLCSTQRTTRELRFVTESWSNFVEKISKELIIRLSALKLAFPMFLLWLSGLQ